LVGAARRTLIGWGSRTHPNWSGQPDAPELVGAAGRTLTGRGNNEDAALMCELPPKRRRQLTHRAGHNIYPIMLVCNKFYCPMWRGWKGGLVTAKYQLPDRIQVQIPNLYTIIFVQKRAGKQNLAGDNLAKHQKTGRRPETPWQN
jgi:hypothetical protein